MRIAVYARQLLAVTAMALATPMAAIAQEAVAELPSVTLDEAIQLAMEHNPQVVQAAGAVQSARASERTALGSFLPTLSLNMGNSLASAVRYNESTNTQVTGSSDSYRAGVSAGWDVFTGGRRGAERARSAAQTAAARAQLVEQRYGTSFIVETAFYAELRAQELITVAEARVERAREGLTAAERRLSVGSATRSDVLRAQLELNTAQESLLQAETQQRSASYTLGRLTGRDTPVRAEQTESFEPSPLPISEQQLIAELAGEAPMIAAAEASLRSAEAGTRAARTQYLPAVRLSSGYNWNNQDFAIAEGRTSWSVGLGLSYPLFNGFQREETVERARIQQRVANAQLADARRGVVAEAERALGELRLAEQRITLAGQAVGAAQEDLRVQQERYELGASTMLELLTSQSSLVEAQNSLVEARFDYQLARAELGALIGRRL